MDREQIKFLNYYKEYETLVRDKGLDPKAVEESADDLRSNRLRMCRILRNYLSHQNDADFVSITKEQLAFLQKEIENLKLEGDVLKSHTKTLKSGACDEKERCSDVIAKFAKLKVDEILVTTSEGLKTASVFEVAVKAVESKTNKMKDLKLGESYKICDPLTSMKELPDAKIIVCSKDGTASGKITGVYYKLS